MKEQKKSGKILFIAPGNSSFIVTDIEILSEKYQVCTQILKWNKKWLTPILLIWQVVFLLKNVWGAKAIIISFGGYWALFPTIFGNLVNIKVALILHGTDCVNFEELGYGNLRKPMLRWVSHWVYDHADVLLPVSEHLMKSQNTFYTDEPIKLGLHHHFRNLHTPYRVIHNGLQVQKWNILDHIRRNEGSFVTVLSQLRMELKGIDLILDVSKKFPDNTFYLVGINNIPQKQVPNNIICLGWRNANQLEELYNKCDFYLQLSSFEGFGISLCEAMLCGCIPIGSDVNLIPYIIGDTGYILRRRNAYELQKLMKKVLSNTNNQNIRERARQRIVDNFPIEKRKKKLIEIIED